MPRLRTFSSRPMEAGLLAIISLIAVLGFAMTETALQVQRGADPLPALPGALAPALVLVAGLWAMHGLLRWQGVTGEQVLWPSAGLLLALGLILIWRLRPPEPGVWQQILRGFMPGLALAALFITRPRLIERLRCDWPMLISLGGLALLLATAFLGVRDEAGATLALKLGPLPAVQTSELIKLALIVFLAWYIDREVAFIEGRPCLLFGRLRLPPLQTFLPGGLFVGLASLILLKMADWGNVLILACLFVAMLYAGLLHPRTFLAAGLTLTVVVGLLLAMVWSPPELIRARFAAFLNPWSTASIVYNGHQTTISAGPGYQLQQAIYAANAGGLTGQGLGFGSPGNIPLAHSDAILAAIHEELGLVTVLALLAVFLVLLLRILRLAMMLPAGQVFERLLAIGIAAHLFTQLFVIAGGTYGLLPLTGVTAPFLSQGGMALMVNLAEIGLVLGLARRLEGDPA